MKGKFKTAIVFFTLGAVATFLAVGVVCYTSRESDRLFKKSDFENLEMFVHNFSCEQSEFLAVDDNELYEEVVSLLVHAEKFRPIGRSDRSLGIPKYNSVNFKRGEEFGIGMGFEEFETEAMQLSTDYIFRERPLVVAGMSKYDSDGNTIIDESWYCYLPAKDYARLLDILVRYTGEEIK